MSSRNFNRIGFILLCLVAHCVTTCAAENVTINLEIKDLPQSDSKVMHALRAYIKRLPDGDPIELVEDGETRKVAEGVMKKTWILAGTDLRNGSYAYEVGGRKNAIGKVVFLTGVFELREGGANKEISLELKYNKICLQPRIDGRPLGIDETNGVSVYALTFERLGARGAAIEQLIEGPLFGHRDGAKVPAFLPLYFVEPGRHQVSLSNFETLEKLTVIVEWPKVPAEECWIDFKSGNQK